MSVMTLRTVAPRRLMNEARVGTSLQGLSAEVYLMEVLSFRAYQMQKLHRSFGHLADRLQNYRYLDW
jgi:hypothetical protein